MRLHVLMSRAQIIHLMTAVITVVSWAFAGLAVEQKKSKKMSRHPCLRHLIHANSRDITWVSSLFSNAAFWRKAVVHLQLFSVLFIFHFGQELTFEFTNYRSNKCRKRAEEPFNTLEFLAIWCLLKRSCCENDGSHRALKNNQFKEFQC